MVVSFLFDWKRVRYISGMTTKMNRALLPIKPRIVIDFDTVNGGTSLTVQGRLTIPQVIDCLMAQTSSLWKKWIESMTSPVAGPSGEPVYNKPANPLATPPNGEGVTE